MKNFELCKINDLQTGLKHLDIFVFAAGFEDRAYQAFSSFEFASSAHAILICYENEVPGNQEVEEKYLDTAQRKFGSERTSRIVFEENKIAEFSRLLKSTLEKLPIDLVNIGVDVSGMPAYLVFSVLNIIRDFRPHNDQEVVYTSAISYIPTKAEYNSLKRKQGEDIEFIPHPMALEMSENLTFEPFSGYRSGDSKSCLALFAGYEAHRSTGVVDAINPTILLLLYGKPGNSQLDWRLDLSQRLHRKFEKTRRCAVEVVSTREINGALAVLEEYYKYLIDDYDLTIAPVCSKMQTLASFVFWERYPEVQITFPIPIGYDPARRPLGVGETYGIRLPGRLSFKNKEAES